MTFITIDVSLIHITLYNTRNKKMSDTPSEELPYDDNLGYHPFFYL